MLSQTITVRDTVYATYPFSDPDPAPFGDKIYPYARYDGYAEVSEPRIWQEVVLENDLLRVRILPAIGGKVWSVYDKKAENELFYDNDAVKFRNIALRGPWTSGGIEFNHGIIGHAPSCSAPVDWKTEKKADGTVSCYIGVLDLLTRTRWTVEISLPAGKDWLLTRTFWHNSTGKFQPYYSWTTAGVTTSDSLRLVFPSAYSVGHPGDIGTYPVDKDGNDLSVYSKQEKGGAKAVHPAGSHKGFFGAWWKENDNGMMHLADRDQKLGRKYFCWPSGEEGQRWIDLLTDGRPQYVELQAGRKFNQNNPESNFTSYRQYMFFPYATDDFSEYWIPFSGTKGVGYVTLNSVVNVVDGNGGWNLYVYPLQKMKGKLMALDGNGKELRSWNVDLPAAELFSADVRGGAVPERLTLDGRTLWTRDREILDRPNALPEGYDSGTAASNYLLGYSFAGQKNWAEAEKYADAALAADPFYVQALGLKAMILLERGDWAGAFEYANRGIAVDQYDPQSNFLSGIAAVELGKKADALDRFEIAAITYSLRSASYTWLSRLHFKDREFDKALDYARRSLVGNGSNITALEMEYLCSRALEEDGEARLGMISALDPLSHFPDFMRFLSGDMSAKALSESIRQEMKGQEYLETALFLESVGLRGSAVKILKASPERNALTDIWSAYLEGDASRIAKAEKAGIEGVFPFRVESLRPLSWAVENGGGWKSRYLLSALLLSLGRTGEAYDVIKDEDGHGFAPFYALRSRAGGGAEDMRRAAGADPSQWRYRRELAEMENDK